MKRVLKLYCKNPIFRSRKSKLIIILLLFYYIINIFVFHTDFVFYHTIKNTIENRSIIVVGGINNLEEINNITKNNPLISAILKNYNLKTYVFGNEKLNIGFYPLNIISTNVNRNRKVLNENEIILPKSVFFDNNLKIGQSICVKSTNLEQCFTVVDYYDKGYFSNNIGIVPESFISSHNTDDLTRDIIIIVNKYENVDIIKQLLLKEKYDLSTKVSNLIEINSYENILDFFEIIRLSLIVGIVIFLILLIKETLSQNIKDIAIMKLSGYSNSFIVRFFHLQILSKILLYIILQLAIILFIFLMLFLSNNIDYLYYQSLSMYLFKMSLVIIFINVIIIMIAIIFNKLKLKGLNTIQILNT